MTWAGWLLPYDRPLALIADDPAAARDALQELRLIGLDAVWGYWTAEAVAAWAAQGHERATIPRIDPAGLPRLLDEGALLLDVRDPAEVALGRMPGSRAIPLGALARRLAEIPRDRTIVVACQSGRRSSMAASLLARAGYRHVVDLVGGYDAWLQHERAISVLVPAD